MKKTLRIIITIVLILAILLCTAWYLFVYDRDFTRDMLLTCARTSENQGYHTVAAWFYDLAYAQSDNSDAVAIELANQYKASGNYTKAEYTLYNAIADGGSVDLYIALSKLYIEQDKLMDAVNMLNGVTDTSVKKDLTKLRPAAPTATPDVSEKPFNEYITVELSSSEKKIYFSLNEEYPSTQAPVYKGPIQLTGGETTITAVTVNQIGLVSDLATFKYIVKDVIEPYTFTDPEIEKIVRELLMVSENEQLYTNDLWTITEFTVPVTAQNYTDIAAFKSLEKLTIEAGQPETLTNLENLTQLKELTIKNTSVNQNVLAIIANLPLQKLVLSGCNVSNIDCLAKATALTYLDLSNNAIRDITAIHSLTTLKTLNLYGNAIVDISALSSNLAITELNIAQNAIQTLAPISGLTNLVTLDASKNQITDLGEISNLKSLTTLNLAENQLSTLDQLLDHTSIEILDISTNQLKNIDPVATMAALKELNFSHNSVEKLPKWNKDCALMTVDGSYNKLTSLENLGGLVNLNVVNVEYNAKIKSVSPLAKCPTLLQVYVFGTAVTDVKALTSQGIVVIFNSVQ